MTDSLEAARAETSLNEYLTPFLRWAGGKRRLVPLLLSLIPDAYDGKVNRYFEPFIGGGSLMLALGKELGRQSTPGRNIVINDTNPDLVVTYRIIRDEVEELISELEAISVYKSRTQFEKVKKWNPKTDVSKAARLIYLNKTCFNGLWRVNGQGEFNVPWGKLKNPKIFDPENLEAISSRINRATITNQSYSSTLESTRAGDLVYLDPPYLPISSTSSFSKYSKNDFGILDHYALSGLIKGLSERKVHVILSNSNTELSRKIFKDNLHLYKLDVTRSISAKSSSRNKVSELIGTNFEINSSLFTQGLLPV